VTFEWKPSDAQLQKILGNDGVKIYEWLLKRPRRQNPKRYRGYQNVGSPRRLIDLITQSPA
jgi:hypothetical protein